MTSMTKLYAAAGCLLLAFVCGLGLGWKLYRGKTTTIVKEVPAPTIYLPGGTTVLEKRVVKTVTITKEKPGGSTVLEEGSIVIQPRPPLEISSSQVPAKITVNFAVLRMVDGSRRVEASSPDGKVIGGVDIVVDLPAPVSAPLLNAAGLVYGTTAWGDTAKGAFYDRDWKFIRTGVELTRNTYATVNRSGWEARVKIGVSF